MGLSAEELELLTDEERRGLEDDELDNDTPVDLDDEEEEDEPELDNEPEREDEPDQDDDEEDDEQEDEPQSEPEPVTPDPEPTQARPPTPVPQLPEDHAQQLEAINTRRAEIRAERAKLFDQYDEGDLTSKEYREALDALDTEAETIADKRMALQLQETQVTQAQQNAQQQAEANWFREADTFLKEHPEINASNLRFKAFDTVVFEVTRDNPSLSDRQQLEMAYKRWADELGIAPTTPNKARKAERNVPPTLANVPAAQVEATDDGKFGQLARLFNSQNPRDVVRAEEMMASMSEADQDRFLANY